MKHQSIKSPKYLLYGLAAALLLAACQPISANPTPAPETLGFEAVPPPAAETLPHATDGTTLNFTSGEICEPVAAGIVTQEGEPILYDCGFVNDVAVGLIGEIESVQGMTFGVERAELAVRAPGARVLSSRPWPFTVDSTTLEDGTTCLNAGEGTNIIVGEGGRVSFLCGAEGGSMTVSGDAQVLINGLYPESNGGFTVDHGTLAQSEGANEVKNRARVAVQSMVAQPLVVTVTADEAGKTIYLTPAQTLEVVLPGNPTTGYSWNISPDSTAPLSQAGDAEFAPDSDAIGAGGTVTMHYDVTGAGSGELVLDYARPWETDVEPVDTFTLNIIVALTPEQNNSEVTLGLGQTLAVALPGNPSTGYTWQVLENDGQILAQTADPVLLAPASVPGAGGVQLFTFQGVAAGEMALNMVYARPWETDTVAANTFALDVTVE